MTTLLAALTFAFSPNPYATEGARLTRATIVAFYDAKAKIWRPRELSSDAVGTQGYTFWPSMLAWQAIVEGAKVDPKTWRGRVGPFFDVLEQYYNVKGKAYCAWKYFPGNDDHFYDDNTWAVVACLEAFEVTGEERYRARARTIFNGFVRGGWDKTGRLGGLRWGTKAGIEDRKDRTVSATAAGALAALLLAKHEDSPARRKEYRAWAKRSLDWIRTKLTSPSGLILDGIKDDGTVMTTIWTYNTGVPIRAAVEYARQTKDVFYRGWAVKLGNAAIDRDLSPMFEGAVPDRSKRYWYDTTYFVQYLVDGMRELSRATGDARYVREARREADYCRTYLKDEDGLYWRNMRLWTIDAKRHTAYTKLTGQVTPELTPEVSERSLEPATLGKPIGERPMVKTVLANAGAARMFWLLGH